MKTDKDHDASEAHLWVCSGENIGHRYALDGPQHRLGRNTDSEIPLDDGRASQHHAKIELQQGTHYVTDTGSTNGTFVNNKRIESPTPLKDGDLIQIGETVFEYVSYQDRNLTINVDGRTDSHLQSSAQDALRQARGDGGRSGDMPMNALVPMQQPTNHGLMAHTQAAYPNHLAYPIAYPDQRGAYLDDEEGSFDLRLLLDRARAVILFFLPYWRSILVICVLSTIIGAASIYLRPPPQEAIFEIDLVPEASQNPLGNFRGNATFFRSAEQSFRSSRLITETLAKLGVKNPTPAEVADVEAHLTFNTVGPPTPNTYTGSFTDPDGAYAVKYLKSHVQTFLETEVERVLKVIKSESDFLTEQLEITAKKLKNTETRLLDFKKENIDITDRVVQLHQREYRLKEERDRATSERERARAEAGQKSRELRSVRRLMPPGSRQVDSYRDSVARVQRELAAARAAGRGPAHPEVVRLEKELSQLQALARKAERNPNASQQQNPEYVRTRNELQNAKVDARVASKELNRINTELKKIRELIEKAPDTEAKYAELTRSYDATKKNYNDLFNQLNTAKVQLEYERASAAARYSIITPSQLKYQPIIKRLLQRGIIGGAIGLFLALGVTALRRFRQQPIMTTSAETGLAVISNDPGQVAVAEVEAPAADDALDPDDNP